MYSKAKIMGHSIHPMLVHFPIALYAATVIAYSAYAGTGDRFWFQFGVVVNIAGVASAAAAAVPGFIDWAMSISSGHPAKTTGLQHMALNFGALVLFAVGACLQCSQWNDLHPTFAAALALSGLGLSLTLVAGVLGAKLVDQHHVGIDLTPEQERLDSVRVARRAHATDSSIRRG